MAENLFVRLTRTESDYLFEWLLLDEATGVVRTRGQGGGEELKAFSHELSWAGSVVVLVPGEDVLLTRAKVPSRKPRQILQALPFAVEDQLAMEVEQTHLAMGRRSDQGEISVGVLNRDLMIEWLDLLQECGVNPNIMIPDTLCVPVEADEVGILLDGDRVLFHVSSVEGFATDRDQVSILLGLLANGHEDDPDVETERSFRIYTSEADEADVLFLQWQAELGAALTNEPLDYLPFEVLCRGFKAKSMNLLQGEFKPQNGNSTTSAKWTSVAALVVIGIILQVSYLVGKGVYLNIAANSYRSQAEALYKEVFPADRNVRDMRRRWRAHIEGGGTTAEDVSSFLSVFNSAALGLQNSDIRLDNVNYNQQRGDLILQLKATTSDQLVTYSQDISSDELRSEIGTINQEANAVKGSVKIRSRRESGS
jgi:general secretion pathway protein L